MELEPEAVMFCLLFVSLECLESLQAKTIKKKHKTVNPIKTGISEKHVYHDRIMCGLNILPFFILKVLIFEILFLISLFHGPVHVLVLV